MHRIAVFVFAVIVLLVARPSFAEAPQQASNVAAVHVQMHFARNTERKPVPFEMVRGILLFKARVAGREVWALLDNGTDRSLIDTGYAKSLGLKINSSGGAMRTPTGRLESGNVDDVEVEIPRQVHFKAPLSAVDLSQMSKIEGRPISLVVGKDCFDYFLFRINQDDQTFEVGPSRTIDVPADLRLNVPPDAQYLVLNNAQSQISITINGQLAVVTVDLGYNGIISLTEAGWNRLGLDELPVTKNTSAWADGRIVTSKSGIVKNVTIGPIKTYDVTISSEPMPDNVGDGQIGMGFFSYFNFAVDMRDHRIWLISRAGNR